MKEKDTEIIDRLMTIKQIHKRNPDVFKESSLYRWVDTGRLKAYRIGSKVMIDSKDLEELLKKSRSDN